MILQYMDMSTYCITNLNLLINSRNMGRSRRGWRNPLKIFAPIGVTWVLEGNGIVSKRTAPENLQWNDVSKRNLILMDMVRFMFAHMNVSVYLWGYALQIAAYILNKVPIKAAKLTSHEL